MWEYVSTVNISQDVAGKYIVRVELANEDNYESAFLKFDASPSVDEIEDAAYSYCYFLNNPPTVGEKY